MSRKLTASDRKTLIKMASTLPVGSGERRAILAGLNKATALREGSNVRDLSRKAEALFYKHDLEEGDRDYGWDSREGYIGRGMVGLPGSEQSVSPLAYTLHSRNYGPESDIGKALENLGFWSDNMGMGWVYYLR